MVRENKCRTVSPSSFLRIALYSVMMNIIVCPLSTPLSAVFGYITIIAFAVYPILSAISSRRLPIWVIVFAFLIVISCLLSIEHFSYNEFRKTVISAVSFLLLYWSISINRVKYSITFRDLFVVSLVLSLTFLVYTFGGFSFTYSAYGEYNTRVFTMGLGNPNAVAVYVMFVIMVLLMKTISEKKWVKRIPLIALILAMGYILICLSSRTVFICSIMAVFFVVFRKKHWSRRVTTGVALLIPFAVVPIWAMNSTESLSYTILGKAIATGREMLYANLLKELSNNPLQLLFGQFFKYPFSNMHNGPLTVLVSIGLLGVICFFAFWSTQLKTLQKQSDTPLSNVAYSFVLLLLVHSSMEAMSVVGTIPYSFFTMLIIKIASGQITLSPYRKEGLNEPSARKGI